MHGEDNNTAVAFALVLVRKGVQAQVRFLKAPCLDAGRGAKQMRKSHRDMRERCMYRR